jgi:hypothetical protein
VDCDVTTDAIGLEVAAISRKDIIFLFTHFTQPYLGINFYFILIIRYLLLLSKINRYLSAKKN